MTLQGADFGEFLEAVHGHRPFRWQTDLAEQVVTTGTWPTALDVPTGMGKTVALDVAVFALAVQSALPPEQRTAPTRTFLVVDRRVIVDQAHERAQRIATALTRAQSGSGVVAAVADALRAIARGRGAAIAGSTNAGGCHVVIAVADFGAPPRDHHRHRRPARQPHAVPRLRRERPHALGGRRAVRQRQPCAARRGTPLGGVPADGGRSAGS